MGRIEKPKARIFNAHTEKPKSGQIVLGIDCLKHLFLARTDDNGLWEKWDNCAYAIMRWTPLDEDIIHELYEAIDEGKKEWRYE